MSFISLAYLIFLPVVTLIHYLLPSKWRWAWLLAASGYFYAYFLPRYLLVLIFIIVSDYLFALWMEKKEGRTRKVLMWSSLSVNIGLLVAFKYFNFFNAEIANLAANLGFNYSPAVLNLILPLGLSFHTFQAMSYTLEVFWKRQPAERHLGVYALYVLFFPQLVAGPIERPQNLLPQLHRFKEFNAEGAISGLRLILLGVFKKCVLADRLALYVDGEFNSWQLGTGLAFWFAAILFAFQIYYDFSAYTDIARGSARILGVELMENFRFPYFSHSPREFWKRWHISLSTWFRDYVYIPLGGSRGSKLKTARNLLIVFLLSGIWHGANWTFVVWGLLHFLYVVVELFYARATRVAAMFRAVATFALVCMAWVFFRAPNLEAGREILFEMFVLRLDQFFTLYSRQLQICLALVTGMTLAEWLWCNYDGNRKFVSLPRAVRWTVYYCMIALIFFAGVFEHNQFIYFQF